MEYEGALYHLMNRGDRREPIFQDDKDREWSNEDLERLPKGDSQKVKIASRLRKETTMTWDWIAQNLAMGASAYAANCVRLHRAGE